MDIFDKIAAGGSKVKDKVILVADRGYGVPIAQRFARDAKQVLYYLMEEDPYPYPHTDEIGSGFENIKVVLDFWKAVKKADAVIFTNVYNGGLPDKLLADGKNVVAALKSEPLETDRKDLHDLLVSLRMPTAKAAFVKGITKLQDYLTGKENKWIKCSHDRGGMETERYVNDFCMISWFIMKKYEWGFDAAENMDFMVEDHIDSECEGGWEGPMLNGEIPPWVTIGYEKKNKLYVAMAVKELPKVYNDIHDIMKPEFKKRGYRQWYATEMRFGKDKKIYVTDITNRFPSPPGELHTEFYSNFSQMGYDLACGVMPKPKPICRYGVQVNISSDHYRESDMAVQVADSDAQWVKLKNVKKIKGGYVIIRNDNETDLGAVVGIDDNLDKAIDKALKVASRIKGIGIEYCEDFDSVKETIKVGESWGVPFK